MNYIVRFFIFFILVGYSSLLISQEVEKKKLKEYKYNNLKIIIYEVRSGDQLKYASLGTDYLIEIDDNNTIINKKESIGGEILETKFSDLDSDNNVEISLFSKSAGTGGYAELYFYEYSNYQLLRYKFPELKPEWQQSYRGKDFYRIYSNYIEYEFPLYKSEDANCCPTGGKILLKYEFTNNELVLIDYKNDKTIVQGNIDNEEDPLMSITIKSISNLPSMDGFSKTDCWFKFYIGENLIGQADKIDDDDSPVFNIKYDLYNYNGEQFKIEVFDHDVTKEELIGNATFIKPISGQYPILFESEDGSIINRGIVDVLIEKY